MSASLNQSHILGYWRDVLKESDFPIIEDSSESISFDYRDLQAGMLPGQIKIEQTEQVIIGLFPFRQQQFNPKNKKFHALLYLPALIDESGELSPDPECKPWIARAYLEPSIDDAMPIIGNFEDFDSALAQTTFGHGESWQDYLEKAENIFEKTGGDKFANFILPAPWQSDISFTAKLIRAKPPKSMATSILDLYRVLLEKECEVAPLLENVIQGHKAKIVGPLSGEMSNTHLHSGQMNNQFGIGPSQRQAVMQSLSLKDGEILAVQGPPGTGKTTLLQSVIASLWVNAALQGDDEKPSIIVGASTNNKAITNILDGFANKMTTESPLLAQRWLPGPLKEYGLYFQEPTGNYHTARRNFRGTEMPWHGLPEKMETPAYLKKAKDFYLEQAAEFFPDQKSVEISDVIKLLQNKLFNYQVVLNNSVKVIQKFYKKQDYDNFLKSFQLFENFQHASSEKQIELQKKLQSLQKELHDEKQRQYNILGWLASENIFLVFIKRIPFIHRFALQRAMAKYNATAENKLVDPDLFAKDLQEHINAITMTGKNFQAQLLAELTRQALDILDRSLRFEMFHLAGRYWEGRWLLEMTRILAPENNEPLGGQSKTVVTNRFHRWSMLMPCFISTLHSLPKVFQYYDGKTQHLLNFIDVLVLDEAG